MIKVTLVKTNKILTSSMCLNGFKFNPRTEDQQAYTPVDNAYGIPIIQNLGCLKQ